jgi:hypothetical protein
MRGGVWATAEWKGRIEGPADRDQTDEGEPDGQPALEPRDGALTHLRSLGELTLTDSCLSAAVAETTAE